MLAALLLAVTVALPGAASGAAASDSPDAAYPWAGRWTSSFGGFAFSVRTEANGRELLAKIGGKVCPAPSQYYAGGYNNPDDQGKIRGCTVGLNHLVGRFESNRTKARGSFDVTRSGAGWRGTWSTDAGDGGAWQGSFKAHFDGDRPAAATPAKRECSKVYVIRPSGKKITANVKLVDLDAKQIAGVIEKERGKYEGYDYKPIGPVTRKQNCAGYVMKRLFGSKMVQANVEPDGFFRKILVPYGTKRLGRLTARAGDVAVYRDSAGVVKHVAMVESNGLRMKILTKDGVERLYRGTFPLGPLRLTQDPLVHAHAEQGKGSVEFWKLDRSRVSIQAVSSGPCDPG